MDDVRGLFLGMPHGTTPAAVTTDKNIIMSSFKSSRNIQKWNDRLIWPKMHVYLRAYIFAALRLLLSSPEPKAHV